MMATQIGFAGDRTPEPAVSRIGQEVQRELLMLPFHTLFDCLSFRVDGETITLTGKVTRPTLRSHAENVIKKIEGVGNVVNEIELLPFSPNDDYLRLSLYRAIYGHTVLQKLAIRAVPPIHIIVERGNVTLEGVVGNAVEKTIAGMQANGVFGVFSVTNNLLVDDATGGDA